MRAADAPEVRIPPAGGTNSVKTGPTLQLDYGSGKSSGNPIAEFMYFVSLIAPEPVMSSQSRGNTQRARVVSNTLRFTGKTFQVTCEMEFTGAGDQRNVIDHTEKIRQHERELKAGASLDEQLQSINIEGTGSVSIEAEGTMADRVPIVNEVRLRFNGHGKESPVTTGLHNIKYVDGAFVSRDEIVARVNTLTFKRKPGQPRMEITIASVKPRDAGDTIWQNFVGSIKGTAANLFIKPIVVQTVGNEAMLNFGQAIVLQAPAFTFPRAKNLKTNP